jgi:peroxiredoxin
MVRGDASDSQSDACRGGGPIPSGKLRVTRRLSAGLARSGLLAAMSWGCGGAPAAPPSAPSPLLSHPAPDFRRPALDGSLVATADWRGHVAVVDFFAEYCAPCARLLPTIEALHRSMPQVVVLGVSEDDDVAATERVIQAHGLTFPVVHDGGHALAGRFRVTDLPATFVVDARGLVRWHGTSEDGNDVRAAVETAR